MKQLLVLSGKGGTGKTSIASAFIELGHIQSYADCDVDAPNLHQMFTKLILPEQKEFKGLPRAKIQPELCVRCGECLLSCRFHAIKVVDHTYQVNPTKCEGCKTCLLVCKHSAISLVDHLEGNLLLYKEPSSVFSTASLEPGSSSTGMVVTAVKKQLLKHVSVDTQVTVIDGSPGIGCPVISSMSGVDLVLIVTEPTTSGISDFKRLIKTASHFGVRTAVCINKATTNEFLAEEIKQYCSKEDIYYVGSIPYLDEVTKLINQHKTMLHGSELLSNSVKTIYEKTINLLTLGGKNERSM